MVLLNRLDERDQARYAADAAFALAVLKIPKSELQKQYDALMDGWSYDPTFQDVRVGEASVTVGYRNTGQGALAQSFVYGLQDEESKINLNHAKRVQLQRLLRIVLSCSETERQSLAASLVDWRDKNSELSIPMGSAEDHEYQQLQYPYEAKDDDFEVLDEILLVQGMTDAYFEKIKDYVTVWGSGKVNINTAPKIILSVLGLSDDIVEKILLYRAGEDGIAGTEDDQVFVSVSEVTPRLSQRFSLTDSQVADLIDIQEKYLTASSSAFRIEMNISLKNKNTNRRAMAVFARDGKVLYWQEG
jgi:type II secretory pathway component PulK